MQPITPLINPWVNRLLILVAAIIWVLGWWESYEHHNNTHGWEFLLGGLVFFAVAHIL